MRWSALALLLTGCVHTTYVTDWFRVSKRDAEWTLIAESGGPKPTWKSEQLVDGKWTQVSNSAAALAIDRGQRVVFMGSARDANRLMSATRDGAPTPFACDGQLFAKRDGALLCVSFRVAQPDVTTSVPVVVTQLTAAGERVGERQRFELPGNANPSWSERTVVGLFEGHVVMVVDTGRTSPTDDFPGDGCALYALQQPPVLVGTPMLVNKHAPYTAPRFAHCNEPEVIALMRGGLEIEPLQGLRGY